MTTLTPWDQALLGAMIGAVAALWAIGFAAYTFVANYFFSKPPVERTHRRQVQNLIVHVLYLVMGVIALVSILESATDLMSGDDAGLPAAWAWFMVVVFGYAILFSFEILTSIWAVSGMLAGRRSS